MMFPKPEPKAKKPRRRMNKIGPVGRRRLAANKRRKVTHAEYLNRCEIGPILKERGITFRRCIDLEDLTWAHSVKHRGGDPVLEDETARSCKLHHFYCLDLLKPAVTAEIVRAAIKAREKTYDETT